RTPVCKNHNNLRARCFFGVWCATWPVYGVQATLGDFGSGGGEVLKRGVAEFAEGEGEVVAVRGFRARTRQQDGTDAG
ncbi:MAG: hypothetical protein AAFX06_30385, partial [Planctomycetota bacterium]